MAQLSSEERIARVELAPIEVQTMVAKAFLRDDIDDEDVQYLFNTDMQKDRIINTVRSVKLNENGENVPIVIDGVEYTIIYSKDKDSFFITKKECCMCNILI